MNNVKVPLYPSQSPRIRSKTRLYFGKQFFSWKRRLLWLQNSNRYVRQVHPEAQLPHPVFAHKTPLIRQLKNADLQLQYNKINNLHLAAARINGLIIHPGEIFSFWYLIGKPTRKKGYLNGMVLCNGSFISGIGGGLCQLSNLIYWLTLHSPLTVTERWRHNYDVFPDTNRTQPFGSGATVTYNYIDLQISNDTDSDYQLLTWLDDNYLYGEWRSQDVPEHIYSVYEKEHYITHEWWGGYIRHNTIYRKVSSLDGQVLGDVLVSENHAIMMYDPMLPSE